MGRLTEIHPGDDESTWPFPGPDHVFIFAALHAIGRHECRDDWVGDEFWFWYCHPLGERLSFKGRDFSAARDSEKTRARILLAKFQPDAAPSSLSEMTAQQFAAAAEIIPHYEARFRESADRRRQTRLRMRQLCANGELVSAYRWESIGKYTRIEAARWLNDNYANWLDLGQAPHREIGPSSDLSQSSYLFIERKSLERLLDEHARVLVGLSDLLRDVAFGRVGKGMIGNEWSWRGLPPESRADFERLIAAPDERINEVASVDSATGPSTAMPPSFEMMEDFFVYEVKQLWLDEGKNPAFAVSQADFVELVCWRFNAACDRDAARQAIAGSQPDGYMKQGKRARLTVEEIKSRLKPYKNQRLGSSAE